MACFSPLEGWRSKTLTPLGKTQITFNKDEGWADRPMTVTCGQCSGCRLERSSQWAVRCAAEAQLYENNCFITLTYNNENMPENGSVSVRELQLFMKRLREKCIPYTNAPYTKLSTGRINHQKWYHKKIRFYACGEYGETEGRPHYHLCLFNHDFQDKKHWKDNKNGDPLYRSAELEKIWTKGYSSLGAVTYESAAYVARYIMKKINGDLAENHYEWIDNQTGEIHSIRPEFTVMSRKPGVGAGWLEKYATDVYPEDFVLMNGKKVRPPRYYDNNYELIEPTQFKYIKRKRLQNLKKHSDNNTPERLRVREIIQERKLQLLPRNHDKEI